MITVTSAWAVSRAVHHIIRKRIISVVIRIVGLVGCVHPVFLTCSAGTVGEVGSRIVQHDQLHRVRHVGRIVDVVQALDLADIASVMEATKESVYRRHLPIE